MIRPNHTELRNDTPRDDVMDRSVLTAAHSLLGTPPFRAHNQHAMRTTRKHRFRHISLPETTH